MINSTTITEAAMGEILADKYHSVRQALRLYGCHVEYTFEDIVDTYIFKFELPFGYLLKHVCDRIES
jgi:hypothetical protein